MTWTLTLIVVGVIGLGLWSWYRRRWLGDVDPDDPREGLDL